MTKNFSWENEFFELEFPDKRLKKRFFKIMDAFSSEPGSSILSACGSREQAKAAYRFFSKDAFCYEDILLSITKATIKKCYNYQRKKFF